MGGIIKSVGDVVLGKKDPGQAAQTIDMNTPEQNALQKQMLDKYSAMANQDFGAMASSMTAEKEAQARQNALDSESRARQLVAQRGLGNSSIGLGAILGQGKKLGMDIANIRADKPLLAQKLMQQNLSAASGGINSILGQQSGAKIYQPAVASQGRQGGLLVPALGIAGAALGGGASIGGSKLGAMGVSPGMQIGLGTGKALQNIF